MGERGTGKGSHIRVRLYSRLLISYMVIFVVVCYLFAFLLTKYYTNYEAVKALQQSWGALGSLSEYYSNKHLRFAETILPMFETGDSYYLERVMLSWGEETVGGPLERMELTEVLAGVAGQDSDIRGVLLYRRSDGACYAYSRKNKTMDLAGPEHAFYSALSAAPSGRLTLGTRDAGEPVYGIGGIVGRQRDAGPVGDFLITFRSEAFTNLLQSHPGALGRFLLATREGDVIYDSTGVYEEERFSQMELLLSGEETVMLDGEEHYLQTLDGGPGGVIAANLVPTAQVADGGIARVIYGGVSLMALVCVALFAFSGRLISRRLNRLTHAMEKAGPGNLSYRIPVDKSTDEFSQLARNFNDMCDELQEMIHNKYVSELNRKTAQLDALQTGVNPHFLYNTLEAIRVMALDAGEEGVSGMILTLANLYRAIVQGDTFIPIGRELNLCEMYMEIFLFRYNNALDYELEVDAEVKGYGIPKNLLQPIIENYFVHGIRRDSDENSFTMRGFLDGGDICFVMEDNGRGFTPEELAAARAGIAGVPQSKPGGYGLPNIQKRIRLIYGAPYGITLEGGPHQNTRITVRIQALRCHELAARLGTSGEKP